MDGLAFFFSKLLTTSGSYDIYAAKMVNIGIRQYLSGIVSI